MVDDARLQDLFKPLTIGSLKLRNRFAMAPMTRGASPGGIPGADVAAYYARRAAGGTALIITEGCASRIRRRAGPTPSPSWSDPRCCGAGAPSPTPCTPRVAPSPPSCGIRAPRAASTRGQRRAASGQPVRCRCGGQCGRPGAAGRRTALGRRRLRPWRRQRREGGSTPSRFTALTATCSTSSSGPRPITAATATAARWSAHPVPGRGGRRGPGRGRAGLSDHLPLLAVEDEPL